MCIRDSAWSAGRRLWPARRRASRRTTRRCSPLSLIHISEPTRLRRISYAVFCLKKKGQPVLSTPLYSPAASDVYKRQRLERRQEALAGEEARLTAHYEALLAAVSYTHLRAHETKANLVCRLLLEKKRAASAFNTSLFAGSVRCV